MKLRHSRISAQKSKKRCEFFVAGTPARVAAGIVGVNKNTATLFYQKLRKIICCFLELESPFLDGEVEVDESYFGGTRKGKRGRCRCPAVLFSIRVERAVFSATTLNSLIAV